MNPTLPDPRNEHIQVYIGGKLYPREEAKISVFDSTIQGGDAVWEGIRVYKGRIFQLDAHLDRMHNSARAMAFVDIPSKEEIKEAIFATLQANKQYDETHIRLTLSRGKKVTSGMSPHWNQYGSTLIVLAEWKKPVYDNSGIRLISSTIRRNPAMCVDSKIHHNNLINNILAKIEANVAGVDDAVMFDINGFVSETNATNIFVVKNGTLFTPHADACLPGITRGVVIRLAEDNGIVIKEKNISVSELYSADELFVTGSMGEITPVLWVDGRTVSSQRGAITEKIAELYHEKTKGEGELIQEATV